MIDIKLVREKPEFVRDRLNTRKEGTGDIVESLLEADQERRKIIAEVEQLKNERNVISKEIGVRKKNKESADDLMAGMKEKSDRITELDHKVSAIDAEQRQRLLSTPNLPHEDCPVGEDESANEVVTVEGEKPSYDFDLKDHTQIGADLDLIDFTSAAKISGSGFVLFKGQGARLQRSILQFMLDLQTTEHGYSEVSPPVLIREECMEGTGQLPKFREDMYATSVERTWLAPTAEVPVTNIHREEILQESQLPIKYAAFTNCFRTEAGSAGRDNRGMIRMHQFDKVELVKFVKPETSFDELEKLRSDCEEVLKRLGLHYRVIELCTGDLGFGATKCYDLEVWAPGSDSYLEVSSCSNYVDFQSRRLNCRYKDDKKKNHFVHTLNGSGLALPRLFVALLETYQQPDGSVKVPEPLQKYFDSDVISK